MFFLFYAIFTLYKIFKTQHFMLNVKSGYHKQDFKQGPTK